MLKIGLTGGIGSGKTTVAQLFAAFNIPVIDADVISHQLSQPQQAGFHQIVQTFGNDIITTDGFLNRDKLRALIFSDSAKKQQLEAILHPLIYREIAAQTAMLEAAYCIICIPLLIETQQTNSVSRILIIDCPVEVQVARVKNRSQLSDTQIRAIIATQASKAQRLAVADDIINNANSASHLAEQVKKLHNLYLLLSSA